MIFNKFVEIGRVVYIARGNDEGKLAVIANVVDGTKLLVDGPSTGVPRSIKNFKDIQLTKFKIKIRVGQRTGGIKKAYDEAGITSKWNETTWAKKLQAKKTRSTLNDFQRYKVQRLKKLRNSLIAVELAKVRKASKKA